jgi:aminoglycoside phosphotransferase (APT) family kinase protein
LAGLPLTIARLQATSDPLYWSSSAVVDGRFVVKFAWSERRAALLWREGLLLKRLRTHRSSLPIPAPVVVHREPALLATRLVAGEPLSWDWARRLSGSGTNDVASELGGFLAGLHSTGTAEVLAGLLPIEPTPQTDTDALRRRFPALVDDRRAKAVTRWSEWVDGVLSGPSPHPVVLVHGDLHGYNQIWDRASSTLVAVVDFEECTAGDPHYDLRYLPGNAPHLDLTMAVIDAYERCCGRRLIIERVMAWHVLTHLGDALWRTEAGIALPGGGTPATYVDELAARFAVLDIS